ncbi:MAG: hypothetical protein K2P74_06845 [Nitrosomonas sp.]|nr:hypothetical protein [Nitrosomonas sp.]
MDKDEVRRLFPECVGVADQFREVFGPGVKLTYAEEGGRSIGKRSVSDPDVTVGLKDILFGCSLADKVTDEDGLVKSDCHAQ